MAQEGYFVTPDYTGYRSFLDLGISWYLFDWSIVPSTKYKDENQVTSIKYQEARAKKQDARD
jgi:hypothetical protein